MWSSWSVLTIILCISKEFQSSARENIPLHLNTLMVVPQHSLAAVADSFQLSLSSEAAFAEPTGISYPLLVLLLGSSYSHFICVWASDAVPRSFVDIRVGHILLGWVWVRWGLITCTPQTSCHSTIIRISCGPGWTGRRAGRFLPLLLVKAGSCFWYLIALCRVVFTPSLDLLGIDMGPLVTMIGEWAPRRSVPLFLCGDGKDLSKWVPHWGHAYKGDIW